MRRGSGRYRGRGRRCPSRCLLAIGTGSVTGLRAVARRDGKGSNRGMVRPEPGRRQARSPSRIRFQVRRLPRPPAPGVAEVWRQAAEAHARWGASDAARRGLDELASGRAVAVVTGQQPDALGGPLFTLHKVLTAASLARRIERIAKVTAVPVFW